MALRHDLNVWRNCVGTALSTHPDAIDLFNQLAAVPEFKVSESIKYLPYGEGRCQISNRLAYVEGDEPIGLDMFWSLPFDYDAKMHPILDAYAAAYPSLNPLNHIHEGLLQQAGALVYRTRKTFQDMLQDFLVLYYLPLLIHQHGWDIPTIGSAARGYMTHWSGPPTYRQLHTVLGMIARQFTYDPAVLIRELGITREQLDEYITAYYQELVSGVPILSLLQTALHPISEEKVQDRYVALYNMFATITSPYQGDVMLPWVYPEVSDEDTVWLNDVEAPFKFQLLSYEHPTRTSTLETIYDAALTSAIITLPMYDLFTVWLIEKGIDVEPCIAAYHEALKVISDDTRFGQYISEFL